MHPINCLPILAVLSPALAFPAPAMVSTNPNAAPLFPMCIEQMNPNSCVLNWNTNTMAVNNDLSNINNFVPYARAAIYSNACVVIGAISNGLTQNVIVNAVGFSQGVLIQNVWDESKGFKVPRWFYNGKEYTVDECACFDGPLMGEPKGTHVCECPFECHS